MSEARCACTLPHHQPRLLVVTGGPGAGKTALLEMVRRHFCQHVTVLPEAASIVFGGGFPRRPEPRWIRAAQRSIYHVERELERGALENGSALVLCDRGTLDGVAYWPDGEEDWASALGTSIGAEQARYDAVIQLRTPGAESYNHDNPLRLETAAQAARVDERILAAWSGHPRRHVIATTHRFIEKIELGLAAVEAELPTCCRRAR